MLRSTNAWRVPAEREPGVIYQHGLYDAAMIEHVSAIEVEGVRFERVRTCEYIGDDISGGCSVCRGWLDPACAYCPSCGAKVVSE